MLVPIYTASGAYDNRFRFYNNKELTNRILRGEDTGFEIIPFNMSTTRRGDIVQLGDSRRYYPHHAEMIIDTFLGYPKLAQTQAEGYAPSDKENDWNNILNLLYRSKYDRFMDQGLQVLRFVGTKAQNKQWEKEYNQLYNTISVPLKSESIVVTCQILAYCATI